MFRTVMILIVCAVFVFRCGGPLLANENTEGDTKPVSVEDGDKAEKVVEGEEVVEDGDETEESVEGEKVEEDGDEAGKVVEGEKVEEDGDETEKVVEGEDVVADGDKAKKSVEDEKVVEEKEVEKKDSDVVAMVNGEKVLRKDLDKRLNVLKKMNQDTSRATQISIIDQLTRKVLLRQFIEKQDIKVDNAEIEDRLEKIKLFFKSNPNTADKPLEEVLELQGSSLDVLKNDLKVELALTSHLKKKLNDGDKEKYFNENKDFFNGEKVRASHVLIDTRTVGTDDAIEKARQKIKKVKKEIDEGADIAELAKKYSDCPSAENGGDIGFFERRGSVVESFAKVAFSMKVGEISVPIKTQYGFHIIKVTERQEGKNVSYDDVKEMVDFVFMEIRAGELINTLVEKAKIEVLL